MQAMTNFDLRSYEVDREKGLVLQRFFNEGVLWLRLVKLSNENVVNFLYWNMENTDVRDSWEEVAKAIKVKITESEDLEKAFGSGFNLFPRGWNLWTLGVPSIVRNSDVYFELDSQVILPATSEFPNA